MSAARDLASLKATIGHVGPSTADGLVSTPGATLVGLGAAPPAPAPVDLDMTMLPEDSSPSGEGSGAASVSMSVQGRTTVLPRRARASTAGAPERPRFDRVRLLGQGAMGAVELARDNDIRRTVAVKRVLPEQGSEAALLRFADEVRIVGQLEHPGIVPVYDVGRDEKGEIYLVMKHLQGETMESVIDRLASGDRAYAERFTIEHRVHLFLSVLDALRYAHARGIIHRDLKPANIMIGPYGEVTVLDWGIAKPIAQPADTATPALERTLLESHDQRLLETQLGSLAGTPLYMSPEQAAGRNDELDARSDVYALTVILVEWLSLRHPLEGKKTVTEVLAATISGEIDLQAIWQGCVDARVPIEYLQVIAKGLARAPAERFQSVDELERALKRILEGHIQIECHVTFAKSMAHRFTHWVDRNVMLYTAIFGLTCLTVVGLMGYGVYRLIH